MAKEGFHGGESRKRNMLGIQLDRESDTLPQSGLDPLFNIVGGRVVLTSIIGEVTVVMGSTGVKITSTPTSIGTAVDIAANLACGTDKVKSLYGIGVYEAAMIGGQGAAGFSSTPIVLPIGTLGITTDAGTTGEIKWSITYIPYDDNAYMEVAA